MPLLACIFTKLKHDWHLFGKNTYLECYKNVTVVSVVMGSQVDGQMWSSHEALVFTLWRARKEWFAHRYYSYLFFVGEVCIVVIFCFSFLMFVMYLMFTDKLFTHIYLFTFIPFWNNGYFTVFSYCHPLWPFCIFLSVSFICNLYSLKPTHYFWLRYDAAWGWITSLLCGWGWSGCSLWWGPSTRVCCCRPVWAMCTGFNHPAWSWTWQHGTHGWCTQWKQLSARQFAASQYEQSSQLGNYTQVQAVSPITGLEWPRGFQEVKVPKFHDNGTGWW